MFKFFKNKKEKNETTKLFADYGLYNLSKPETDLDSVKMFASVNGLSPSNYTMTHFK